MPSPPECYLKGGLRLERRGRTEWLLLFIGILSVLIGIVELVVPRAGALAFVWTTGTYATVTDALLLVLGLDARNCCSAVRRDKQNPSPYS